jgi:hypothetical protein
MRVTEPHAMALWTFARRGRRLRQLRQAWLSKSHAFLQLPVTGLGFARFIKDDRPIGEREGSVGHGLLASSKGPLSQSH